MGPPEAAFLKASTWRGDSREELSRRGRRTGLIWRCRRVEGPERSLRKQESFPEVRLPCPARPEAPRPGVRPGQDR